MGSNNTINYVFLRIFLIFVIHIISNKVLSQIGTCVVKVSNSSAEYVKCTNIMSIPLDSMNEHWTHIIVDNPLGFLFSVPGDGNLLSSIKELDLSRAGSASLSEKAFKNYGSLYRLDISNNSFQRLSGHWFQAGNQLENLNAGFNRINELEAMDNFNKLLILNLDWNNIGQIKAGTFKDLINLEELHLNGNRLESLDFLRPDDILPKLKVFNVNRNRIRTIQSTTIGNILPDLQHLNLAQNVITEIPKNVLDPFQKLLTFNISYNMISNVPKYLASVDSKLEILDLRGNNIERVNADVFSQLPSLKKLDLSKNEIVAIHANAFRGLGRMYKLLLEGNKLLHIHPKTFAPLSTNLERLMLSDNQLQTLNNDMFGNKTMSKLRKIYFKSNHLFEIDENTFENTPNLDYLTISYNALVTLNPQIFKDLRKMKQLYVAYNRIETLPERIFNYMPALQTFYINNNRLTYFPTFTDQWRQLKELILDGNPWQCLCLEEIERVLSNRNIFFGNNIKSPYYAGMKPICVVTPKCDKLTSQTETVTLFENAINKTRQFSDFIVSK